LTARFGWRAVFIANVPIILLALAMIRMAGLKGPAPKPATTNPAMRFDVLGSMLLGGALTLLVVTTRLARQSGLWTGLTGAALLVAFVLWERRASEPVLDLRLFRRRVFVAANMVIGLQNLAMYALLFQLPIFFEQVRRIEPGVTGRTIISMMIAMVVSAPLGGRLSERLGARTTAFIGSLSALTGISLIGSFGSLFTPPDTLAGLIFLGVGLGLSSAPSQAAAMNTVGRHEAGMAGGAISMARYIGGIIGISALGYLLASNSDPATHTTATVVYAFALAAAALASLLLPSRQI
jgi:MFS family permease